MPALSLLGNAFSNSVELEQRVIVFGPVFEPAFMLFSCVGQLFLVISLCSCFSRVENVNRNPLCVLNVCVCVFARPHLRSRTRTYAQRFVEYNLSHLYLLHFICRRASGLKVVFPPLCVAGAVHAPREDRRRGKRHRNRTTRCDEFRSATGGPQSTSALCFTVCQLR